MRNVEYQQSSHISTHQEHLPFIIQIEVHLFV